MTSNPAAIDPPACSHGRLLTSIEGDLSSIYAAATTTIVFGAENTPDISSYVAIIGENTVFDGAGSSPLWIVDGGRLTLRSLELRIGYTTGNGDALSRDEPGLEVV